MGFGSFGDNCCVVNCPQPPQLALPNIIGNYDVWSPSDERWSAGGLMSVNGNLISRYPRSGQGNLFNAGGASMSPYKIWRPDPEYLTEGAMSWEYSVDFEFNDIGIDYSGNCGGIMASLVRFGTGVGNIYWERGIGPIPTPPGGEPGYLYWDFRHKLHITGTTIAENVVYLPTNQLSFRLRVVRAIGAFQVFVNRQLVFCEGDAAVLEPCNTSSISFGSTLRPWVNVGNIDCSVAPECCNPDGSPLRPGFPEAHPTPMMTLSNVEFRWLESPPQISCPTNARIIYETPYWNTNEDPESSLDWVFQIFQPVDLPPTVVNAVEPYGSFSLVGTLPTGVSMDSDGLISGIPTQGSEMGQAKAEMTDGNGELVESRFYTWRVTGETEPLQISYPPYDEYDPNPIPEPLWILASNNPFSVTLAAIVIGGFGDVTFEIIDGVIPPSWTFNEFGNGSFSRPKDEGISHFQVRSSVTVRGTDESGATAEVEITYTVGTPP